MKYFGKIKENEKMKRDRSSTKDFLCIKYKAGKCFLVLPKILQGF